MKADSRQSARSELGAIATTIQENGERPDGMNTPEGETVDIGEGQTIYGGGAWFVVGSEYIWYVQNNGMDGDNWDANNVRTGGAGAIGWRVPADMNLADRIRQYGALQHTTPTPRPQSEYVAPAGTTEARRSDGTGECAVCGEDGSYWNSGAGSHLCIDHWDEY